MAETFTILLAGEVYPTQRLQRQVASSRFIAADSGIEHAAPLHAEPELWLGDFDSTEEAFHAKYATIERSSFSADKDKTDGALAIEEAIKRGAKKLILCGAFGGPRYDHVLAHTMMALSYRAAGYEVLLTSGMQEGYALLPTKEEKFDFPEGTTFSVIAMEPLQGLSLRGAKWELEDKDIALGSTLTLSNRVKGTLSVSLRSGKAMLIAYLEK